MVQLTTEYKKAVRDALLQHRTNFDGPDEKFAKQFSLNPSIFSRLKNGEDITGLVSDVKWLDIGQRLDVTLHKNKWVMVETDVYRYISEAVAFAQLHAKSFMLVDESGIGKTYAAKYLSRTLRNCFYLDGSQAKGKTDFIRLFARTIGVNDKERLSRVKASIKYALKVFTNPVIIIDEGGDLDDKTFLEIKEIWNATEGCCGWCMMGADGLQEKVERNINNRKPGFTEIFSRFGEKYVHIVPADRNEKKSWYNKLITDVLLANGVDESQIKKIVNRCLRNDSGKISGLRRAESLLLIQS